MILNMNEEIKNLILESLALKTLDLKQILILNPLAKVKLS